MAFHGLISEMSGHSHLGMLLESPSGSTLRARIRRGPTEQNSVRRTLAEHRAIVDAVELGHDDLVRSSPCTSAASSRGCAAPAKPRRAGPTQGRGSSPPTGSRPRARPGPLVWSTAPGCRRRVRDRRPARHPGMQIAFVVLSVFSIAFALIA